MRRRRVTNRYATGRGGGRAGRGWSGRSRVAFVAVAAVVVGSFTAVVAHAVSANDAGTTLGTAAAKSGRYFGAAIAAGRMGDAAYTDIANREFSMITPENEMKWDATEGSRGNFNFGGADKIVDNATAHGQRMRGHTLVWHAQLPNWVQGIRDKATLSQVLDDHIKGVAGHYKGKIYAWDVVNEAFNDGPSGTQRSSVFHDVLGDGFIEQAFRTAHSVDPAAKLCYNDYNLENWTDAKTQGVYRMVKDFKSRGVPIDCVGFQAHFGPGGPPGSFGTTLKSFADLGVDVQLTELDIENSSPDAYTTTVKDCVSVPRCTGITVWGVRDTDSWRGGANPLLFDGAGNKKPAYNAVVDALNGAPQAAGDGGGGAVQPAPAPSNPPANDPAPINPPASNPAASSPAANNPVSNLAGSTPGCGKAPTLTNGPHTIQSAGQNRNYILSIPDNYDNKHPYRLIFGLHWLGGNADAVANAGGDASWAFYGQKQLSNNSTIFVAPQGIDNGWANSGGRDLALVDDLTKLVENDLCVDTSQLFAMGWSYGGAMSYAIACARADVFRGVVAYSGAELSGCDGGTKPIAYFGIHGTHDSVLNISLGRSLRDRFVKNNGCTEQNPPEPPMGSGKHIVTAYTGCKPGYPVQWGAFDGDHIPNPVDGGANRTWTSDEAWKFISQFASTQPAPAPQPPAPSIPAQSPAPSIPADSGGQGGACSTRYQQIAAWDGGFLGSVTVTNTGSSAINGWTVRMTMASGQSLVNVWNGTATGKTGTVTVGNAAYNRSIGAQGTQVFGFVSTGKASAPAELTCAPEGSTPAPAQPSTSTPTQVDPAPATSQAPTPTAGTTTPAGGSLPASFKWSSSGALMSAKPDAAHPEAGLKDPSVVYYNGKWHVFSSVASANGYNLEYRSFTDWSQAGAATPYFLDKSGIGGGYRAAPQVFYFAPQKLWYLVYQTGNASYSTNPDISNPAGWSAPKNFYPNTPATIQQNIGDGFWLDMWVICDDTNCYLFSSDDNGHLYRSQTSLANFPNGMSQPVITLQDPNKFALFEASNVYKVAGSNTYLLVVEALGARGRYYRSWTATSLGGTWTPLADSENNPFAGAANTTFAAGAWTNEISHGEAIRSGYDQTMTINPCKMQYLYQGRDPSSGGDYNTLPWKLGLLTQTNSTCS
jgi:GH35 family endo-1,4-beta-xylanase/poly(3-hydroxybutyrate) depolymerase